MSETSELVEQKAADSRGEKLPEIGTVRINAHVVASTSDDRISNRKGTIGVNSYVIAAVVALLSLVPAWNIYAWKQSQVTTEINRNEMLQGKHAAEIDAVRRVAKVEVQRERDVAEARIQRERDKGLWADYVQPMFDWIRGSDVEVEAGVVSVKVEPKD